VEAQGSKRDSVTCDCGAIALRVFEGRDSGTKFLFHIMLAEIVSAFLYTIKFVLSRLELEWWAKATLSPQRWLAGSRVSTTS
jgi:hypothetical protein